MAQMKKKTKKKAKKSLKLYSFSGILLLCSAFLYLCSSLFLRSYNNALSTQKQKIDSEIAVIETQNDAITVEIQTLSTKERIDEVALSSGMSVDQNNIITVGEEAESEIDADTTATVSEAD